MSEPNGMEVFVSGSPGANKRRNVLASAVLKEGYTLFRTFSTNNKKKNTAIVEYFGGYKKISKRTQNKLVTKQIFYVRID